MTARRNRRLCRRVRYLRVASRLLGPVDLALNFAAAVLLAVAMGVALFGVGLP